MDPLKSIIDFQKEIFSQFLPEQLIAPLQEMSDKVKTMDPGKIVSQLQTIVEDIIKFTPLPQFQSFLTQLKNYSGDFSKIFEQSLVNPIDYFKGFFK